MWSGRYGMDGVAAERTRVLAADELAPGSVLGVEVAGRRLCLARTLAGDVLAVDDRCSHEDEPLSGGWLDGDRIECPAHNAVFDLRSGEAVALPATEPVGTYDVVEDGDGIHVVVPQG
jgi:nitrite reductase/ring-hydroxylating ferredoxin subunit